MPCRVSVGEGRGGARVIEAESCFWWAYACGVLNTLNVVALMCAGAWLPASLFLVIALWFWGYTTMAEPIVWPELQAAS